MSSLFRLAFIGILIGTATVAHAAPDDPDRVLSCVLTEQNLCSVSCGRALNKISGIESVFFLPVSGAHTLVEIHPFSRRTVYAVALASSDSCTFRGLQDGNATVEDAAKERGGAPQ